jgi:anti-sigma B factor antagonist
MQAPDADSAGQTPSGISRMTIRTERTGDAVVLVVSGEVDMTTAPELDSQAGQALRNRPPVLVIDLSDVTFLGSAGMSSLVAAGQEGDGNTSVRIVATGAATARPMQLVGLDQLLAIHPTREAALADG